MPKEVPRQVVEQHDVACATRTVRAQRLGRPKRIEVRLYPPQRAHLREYRCRCEVIAGGKRSVFSIAGADGLQALLLAAGFLGRELQRLENDGWCVPLEQIADMLRILPNEADE